MQAHHVRTSPFRPQTNSLTELQNRSIVRHLRAFCTDSSTFHQFLPAISAAINGTTNVTLGVSPFFVLYGVNYRFPFETALTSNEQPFREWDRPGLQPLAQRLEIVRIIIRQNIKDARANTERFKNVNAKPHDFQVRLEIAFSFPANWTPLVCLTGNILRFGLVRILLFLSETAWLNSSIFIRDENLRISLMWIN
jgi:hypothetical protein